MNYGTNMDSEEARAEFENYQKQKEIIKEREQDLKDQKNLFKTTDTFKMA
jgi:hypothetical protein